jgi:hypothetical protein
LKVITPVIAQLGEQREGYKWEARETKWKEVKNEQDILSRTSVPWEEISPVLTNSTHVCMELQGTARTAL